VVRKDGLNALALAICSQTKSGPIRGFGSTLTCAHGYPSRSNTSGGDRDRDGPPDSIALGEHANKSLVETLAFQLQD